MATHQLASFPSPLAPFGALSSRRANKLDFVDFVDARRTLLLVTSSSPLSRQSLLSFTASRARRLLSCQKRRIPQLARNRATPSTDRGRYHSYRLSCYRRTKTTLTKIRNLRRPHPTKIASMSRITDRDFTSLYIHNGGGRGYIVLRRPPKERIWTTTNPAILRRLG